MLILTILACTYNFFMNTPYLNAFYASAYIVLVVSLLQSQLLASGDAEILSGMVFLSIFVLSVAVMGYLFVGQPILLYLDGKKKEAVSYFFKTIASFAGLTALLVVVKLLVAVA